MEILTVISNLVIWRIAFEPSNQLANTFAYKCFTDVINKKRVGIDFKKARSQECTRSLRERFSFKFIPAFDQLI